MFRVSKNFQARHSKKWLSIFIDILIHKISIGVVVAAHLFKSLLGYQEIRKIREIITLLEIYCFPSDLDKNS
jgi:hypothetical protein